MPLNTEEINKVNDLYKQIDVLKAENELLKKFDARLDTLEVAVKHIHDHLHDKHDD